MIDLSTLELSIPGRDSETDPLKIFAGLTQRGNIEGLYGPQQDALSLWHSKFRAKSDIVYSLNTGGGKTLVGLLTAQSLVNEGRGKVLYACVTNQLVEQTVSQADQCGIRTASYSAQNWINKDIFDSGQGFCVTNYHALFRGGSWFAKEKVCAVIFDDAHVAPAIIRECYTLQISTTHPSWGPLMSLFRSYFETSPFFAQYNRFVKPDGRRDSAMLFVPSWFVIANVNAITRTLEDNGVTTETSKWSYQHLQNHLGLSCFLISQMGIEIGPTVLPTHSLPYFKPAVRRVYMSATLPNRYDCIRTFGVDRAEVIAPAGKAGAAQRLFVFPPGKNGSPYEETRSLCVDRKACIIVPSGKAAEKWHDVASHYNSQKGHSAIKTFMEAKPPAKLVIAALYDGIDLPGKSCNVLVLDGLPKGSSLHDRFIESVLDIQTLKTSNTAIRITQSIGRIFRSNTDHGVVVLADSAIQSWLVDPFHAAFLPPLLQQQIKLGNALRKSVENGSVTYFHLMNAVINGDKGWDALYNRELGKCNPESTPKQASWGDQIARKEFDAFREAWEGRLVAGGAQMIALASELDKTEPTLAAWYRHWAGAAFTLSGKEVEAIYRQAANAKFVLGNPRGSHQGAGTNSIEISPQARRAAITLDVNALKRIEKIRTDLRGDGGPNADYHERSLRELGSLLGFEATRPDHEFKKGPDVLWCLPELKSAFGMEAKTQKHSPKVYKKNATIGKIHNDAQWIDENHPGFTQHLTIIGPLVGVAKEASPPLGLRVIPLSNFQYLADRLLFAAQHFAASPSDQAKDLSIQISFELYGLIWPRCIDAMDYRTAIDLQSEENEDEEEVQPQAVKPAGPA